MRFKKSEIELSAFRDSMHIFFRRKFYNIFGPGGVNESSR